MEKELLKSVIVIGSILLLIGTGISQGILLGNTSFSNNKCNVIEKGGIQKQEINSFNLNSDPDLCEALDNCDVEWCTPVYGDKPWVAVSDEYWYDNDSARSGDINNSEVSDMCCYTSSTTPVQITFYWKVDSEGSDLLIFYIDGDRYTQISGEIQWKKEVVTVGEPGDHEFRWAYVKDKERSAGRDCGWVDCVNITYKEVGYDIYVNDDYEPPYPPNYFDNIPDAIDAAEDGDSILVYEGNYICSAIVDKSISISGNNIYGTHVKSEIKDYIFNIISPNVKIGKMRFADYLDTCIKINDHLFNITLNNNIFSSEIIDAGETYYCINMGENISRIYIYSNIFQSTGQPEDEIAIYSPSGHNISIYENFFSLFGYDIVLSEFRDSDIYSNIFSDTDRTAIQIGPRHNVSLFPPIYCKGIKISRNEFKGTNRGIEVDYSHCEIQDNHFIGYIPHAIYVYESSNFYIQDNVIDGSGDTDTYGIYQLNSEKISIEKNIINHCWRGIYIYWDDVWRKGKYTDDFIKHNIITDNDVGILLLYSTESHIDSNHLYNNNNSIYLEWSGHNEITNNNIYKDYISIFPDVFFQDCFNIFEKNWWGELRLKILPKFIVGSMAILGRRIGWLDFDWTPSTQEYTISFS